MKNKAGKPWSQGKAKLPPAWSLPFDPTLSSVPHIPVAIQYALTAFELTTKR